MNAYSLLTDLLRPRARKGHPATFLIEPEQVVRVPPTLDADNLPPEFEGILEVQVLGYRERLTNLDGHRQRVLDPVWTLVPKER
jgi:hypothetical protein